MSPPDRRAVGGGYLQAYITGPAPEPMRRPNFWAIILLAALSRLHAYVLRSIELFAKTFLTKDYKVRGGRFRYTSNELAARSTPKVIDLTVLV